MFQVGDIVKLKPSFIGDYFLFRIWNINRDSAGFYYNLRRVEQELDLTRGSPKWQLDLIDRIEHQDWRNGELEPVESCLTSCVSTSAKNDAVDSLAYATLSYDKFQTINTINIDTGTTLIDEFNKIQKSLEELSNKNVKEENEMEILKLYKQRKDDEIGKEYNDKKKELLEKDTIQNIINEMTDQVNAILESEENPNRLKMFEQELLTKETNVKLEKLKFDTDKKYMKVNSTIEEVEALFNLTSDYQERMKILEKYGIIKNGKVNF